MTITMQNQQEQQQQTPQTQPQQIPQNSSSPTSTSGMPAPAVASRVGEVVLRHAKYFTRKTKLQDTADDFHELEREQIQIGQLLGHGGFSEVFAVKLVNHESTKMIDESAHSAATADMSTSMDDTNDSSWNCPEGERYALKMLKPSVLMKEKSFKSGAIDLCIEGMILRKLDHENIIKIHGVSTGCVSQAYTEENGGYFLVLDRLFGTVAEKIELWSQTEVKVSRSRLSFRPAFVHGRPALLKSEATTNSDALRIERIESVALPVAKAMDYLHKKNIVFRDLKPSNLGFDADGNIKVFDFGLAREIVRPERRMTGNTGSLRYMAPEVARREHYGLPVDVYSFSLMLWELCTLQKPYEGMTRADFAECVVFAGERPAIDSSSCGSSRIKDVITSCWDHAPSNRMTFEEIVKTLKKEIATSTANADTTPKEKVSFFGSRKKTEDVKKNRRAIAA
mmetsp:Transcript_17777/g.24693  ORF Transcript_17777/g.24693 Transcript_17777/m.24693 type:complete len:452 (+) Transcript_17777:64-1419(+)